MHKYLHKIQIQISWLYNHDKLGLIHNFNRLHVCPLIFLILQLITMLTVAERAAFRKRVENFLVNNGICISTCTKFKLKYLSQIERKRVGIFFK